mmetsp:Transcript_74550/g.201671  ORF Transcript_74550/g.201671 Transcript_74550/m.201671 type:complete len:275 (-) Transcript_74550:371-1195(-)
MHSSARSGLTQRSRNCVGSVVKLSGVMGCRDADSLMRRPSLGDLTREEASLPSESPSASEPPDATSRATSEQRANTGRWSDCLRSGCIWYSCTLTTGLVMDRNRMRSHHPGTCFCERMSSLSQCGVHLYEGRNLISCSRKPWKASPSRRIRFSWSSARSSPILWSSTFRRACSMGIPPVCDAQCRRELVSPIQKMWSWSQMPNASDPVGPASVMKDMVFLLLSWSLLKLAFPEAASSRSTVLTLPPSPEMSAGALPSRNSIFCRMSRKCWHRSM